MDPSYQRTLFDTDVAMYRDGRPGYPAAVFDLLREHCGLGPGVRVLEIGPGTGQATGPLLDAGASVVAIELGPGLAQSLAEANAGRDLSVIVGPFEEVTAAEPEGDAERSELLPDGSFDIVAAATSFHWIPAESGLAAAHRLLRPGGFVALWRNYWGDPERPDPFHEAIVPLLAERAPQLLEEAWPVGITRADALGVATRLAEIGETGLFGPVYHTMFPWTGRHTADEIKRMFGSFSPWLALEPDVRGPLLGSLEALAVDQFDGVVERPYLTSIYLAQKAAG